MTDSITDVTDPSKNAGVDAGQAPYDKRRLSYANTFTNPWKANTIRTMEWMTGKITLLRRIRRFERAGLVVGQEFWTRALDIMGIDLQTPADQIARIPATGPLVVVANHPHGLVDGMVLAYLVGQVRQDYKILTRSLLTGIAEVSQYMIPVPFPHEDDALKKNLDTRRQAMDQLEAGGVIVVFPSGSVANADQWFGPAIEAEWNPFTAKMIQRSGATVLPIYFPGQNSRWYQIASQISPTIRQGLLLHEVVHSLNRPQAPVIGHPIAPEEMADETLRQREFMAWLRDRTLSLRNS